MGRCLTIFCIALISACASKQDQVAEKEADSVSVWLTTADKSHLLHRQGPLYFKDAADISSVIDVDTSKTFQQIDGFGYALTGGSASLLHQKLKDDDRQMLLRELFTSDDNNIGISYLRISVGASDLDDHPFSYLDLPTGKTDVPLSNFDLAPDKAHLIPMLKSILAYSPKMKIMASPWSAPPWMKSNGSFKGGKLKTKYYDAYARYLVKYIKGMAAEGIVIDALTLQNEPENDKNNPSMLMTAQDQATFVAKHLGPLFKTEGIATRIIVFDHNADHPEYPITVLNDDSARQYIEGSAFHLYLGEIAALSKVHDAHPDKSIYFTEQWTSGRGDFGGDLQWHVSNLIVGATRNWSRAVIEWNLAADPAFNPHTDDGGCTECLGALTIGDSVTRNVSYYIIAHASKFARPGAVRIESIGSALKHVAFRNTSGQKVLILLNETDQDETLAIREGSRAVTVNIPGHAVETLVWK